MPSLDSFAWLAALAGALVVASYIARRGSKRLTGVLAAARTTRHAQVTTDPAFLEAIEEVRTSLRLISSRLDRIESRLAQPSARVAHAAGGGPSPSNARPGRPLDPLTQKVFALADEGHASLEIARRLKEHRGKIELILALRERQSA